MGDKDKSRSLDIKSPCQVKTRHGDISFMLIKSSRRKNISIQIGVDTRIKISAPRHISQQKILDFVQEKSYWINDKINFLRSKYGVLTEKRFKDGFEYLFLGKNCSINVVENQKIKRGLCEFNGMQWKIELPLGLSESEKEKITKSLIINWYKDQAKELIGGRIFYYSRIINVSPEAIAVRTHKRIWGNCDFRHKTIHINWHIVLAPLDVIDYVVVHELCHLIHPNHSTRFWSAVEKIMPDYKSRKKWLTTHALDMSLPPDEELSNE